MFLINCCDFVLRGNRLTAAALCLIHKAKHALLLQMRSCFRMKPLRNGTSEREYRETTV